MFRNRFEAVFLFLVMLSVVCFSFVPSRQQPLADIPGPYVIERINAAGVPEYVSYENTSHGLIPDITMHWKPSLRDAAMYYDRARADHYAEEYGGTPRVWREVLR